jgi:site-specific recombinase
MDIEQLRTAFRAADIILVEVEDLDGLNDSRTMRVAGELLDYISAVKALRIPVVFVYIETLEAEEFMYRPSDDDTDAAEDSEEQDLCSINMELKQFKEHIGEVGSFTLYAAMQPKGVTHFIENAWYAEFWKCRVSTTDSIDRKCEAAQADLDNADTRRLCEVTARLKHLVNDKKFARLPTQKAMMAYAKLNIAGIDEMDAGTLKEAISDIAAQILAKRSE